MSILLKRKKTFLGIAFFAILIVFWVLTLNKTQQLSMPKEYAEITVNTEGYVHLSVDDSNSIFEDLTVNEEKYKSAFDQPLLKYVKKLHDRYGAKVSFYVFYSWDVDSGSFTLSDATDAFADDFAANSDWLRFGFHAIDASSYQNLTVEEEQEYYKKTIAELLRITGSKDCIDSFIRLDRYVANQDVVNVLHECGITGLLICEKEYADVESYDLYGEQLTICYNDDWYVNDDGLAYTPTDMNLESIQQDDAFFQEVVSMFSQPNMIVFTHEWCLGDAGVQKYMSWICQIAEEKKIEFQFPEDKMGER